MATQQPTVGSIAHDGDSLSAVNAEPASASSSSPLSSLLSSLSLYVSAEMSNSASDYAVLAQCNDVAASKYARLTDQTSRILNAVNTLQATYLSLSPFLSSIDDLDGELAELETIVAHLELQTKTLSENFRQLYQ